jgi:succinoglycan biosynthesis transport protein ExoP
MILHNPTAMHSPTARPLPLEYLEDGAQGPDGRIPRLVRYWGVAIRRRWIIAAVVAVTLLLGFGVTLLTTPLYTATATIEIARQQDRIVNVEGVEPKTEATDLEFYQTQYSLLRARSLAERVAASLRLPQSDAFFVAFGVDPAREGLTAGQASSLSRADQLARRQELAAEILLDHVSISPMRGSRLVAVSFTGPERVLSRNVANTWTQDFIASGLERRFGATAYARRFLEQRLEQVRQRLEASERRLVAYAAEQQIISVGSSDGTGSPDTPRIERPLIAEDLAALNQELARATGDRIRAQSRNTGNGASSTEALTNGAINVLRQRRAEVAAEYANMMSRFEPNYPPALALNSQVEQLDRAIAREEGRVRQSITNTYTEAQTRERALQGRVDELKSGLLDLRRRSIQYNIYQRDVDTNRELYQGLLQRYKEVGVAGGVGNNNISVVDAALVPDRPSSPRLLTNLLLALLLGLALSAAVVFVLEQIDDAIKDPSDLQRAIGLPVLGTVPRPENSGQDALELIGDRKSAMSEAYLSIQTNLQFSTDHGFPRAIAITSTRAGEGKSTSAYALAQQLARMSRKVILVDGDMRSPSIGSILGLSSTRGLSNFLTGDDDLATMIVSSQHHGLDALLAGPSPPSAAELLAGTRLEELITKLRLTYDHVVVDSPPVLGLADAPLIGRSVEGVVYVIEARGPRASNARTAISRLESAGAPILGAILTKFDARRATYGYGYEYGYGYGNTETNAA